jgi:proteasome assembly chaperone (PAC2) family protein
MHPSIRILNRIEPKSPVLVAAWPGMGNVAFGAAMYLKERLDAAKFAEIDSKDIFYRTGVQIKDGIVKIPELPKSEFFHVANSYGKNDLIIFIGESQPVMEKEYELAMRVVEVADLFKVNEIVTFAATPVNITHRAEPGVWGVASDARILREMPQYGVRVMNAGHIGGLNGLLLGVAKEAGIGGLCLLGEIPFYTAKIENPKSSLSILKVFIKYKNVEIDFEGLEQMAKFVEEEVDKVSKTTKQTLFGDDAEEGKKGSAESPPEGAGDDEKIVSPEVRDKIEYLFNAATEDISKAGELKKELDRWGVFQEYEDRFLDLFGKRNM